MHNDLGSPEEHIFAQNIIPSMLYRT